MKGAYQRGADRLNGLHDVAPLVLRLVAGWMFILHALGKYDQGLAGFQDFLVSLDNVPLPELTARVVPLLELVGGIALIVGLATRPFALLLALEMAFTGFAVKLAKLDTGVLGPQGVGGAEVDFLYLAVFVALLLIGPGRISVDAVLGLERRRA